MNKSFIIKNITKYSDYYQECLDLSTISKQLYNVGIYGLRQSLINNSKFLTNKEVYQIMKSNENWKLLPAKVSNQVWKQVITNWSSWLKALKVFHVKSGQ